MTPGERLAMAASELDAMDLDSSDLNFIPLHVLIAVGQLLLSIDSRQQQAGS